ncbi:GtrA family protein [Ruegeria sp. Ofav3-42]|uniref:GtrA family protein n=1 Tax=Ruegeria sp. Ofav3-42 TaxID=2917759 RepID=UPI001EF525C9|nr:GtrA family protein [Ruegeria sp. Ofav3-42]MCG7522003.1 GtrA family protein [Ruegeria sp. Ofav3-42]
MRGLFQLLRFSAVGGAATLLHYGVAATVMLFDATALMANTIGFAGAFGFGFLGHQRFTFHDGDTCGQRSLAKYCAVSLGSFLSGQTLLALILTFPWMPETTALFLTIILVAAVNFLLSRNWAFAAAPKPRPGGDAKRAKYLYGE